MLDYKPAEVITNINKIDGFKNVLTAITAKRAADSSLRDLGSLTESKGAFRHEVFSWIG